MDSNQTAAPSFERPSRGIAKLLNRGLGPLPGDTPDLSLRNSGISWQPADKPRSIFILTLIAGVLASVFLVQYLAPWTRYSVISGILALLPISDRLSAVVYAICLDLYLFAIFVMVMGKKSQTGKRLPGFLGPAMAEELWFRTGCERWSWRQRLYSCIAFGAVHILNLVIPICVAVVLSANGVVFMLVYMHTYRKTTNVRLATIASGRFHARYNELLVFVVMPVLALGALIYSLVH